jgi:hypothetical protein
MGTSERKGRQDGTGKVKEKKEKRDAKLTLRFTRSERKRIRGYAIECDLPVNELVLRALAPEMGSWYTVRRGGAGLKLAPGTGPADGPSPASSDDAPPRAAG